jgi:hypothetical protein
MVRDLLCTRKRRGAALNIIPFIVADYGRVRVRKQKRVLSLIPAMSQSHQIFDAALKPLGDESCEVLPLGWLPAP